MVLSKLRHASAASNQSDCERDGLVASLQALLGGDLAGLHSLDGGTLGVVFSGVLCGRERCFKTHAWPSGQLTLKREHVFLSVTAGDRADARLIVIDSKAGTRTWLNMKLLRQCDVITPALARELVATYEAALHGVAEPELVPAADNIHLLLHEADAALTLLSEQRLLSVDVQRRVQVQLAHLHSVCAQWSLQLCHGDLGPANIMCDDSGTLAIDWEDAFWGIAGYDYLYWLTFFSNRKWLSRDALGYTPWGRSSEVALMVMVLLLKCVLSVRDGSHRRNTMSFNQRLLEVLDLE